MVHQNKRGAQQWAPWFKRLVGQAVKTPASHAGNAGSIPARVTKKSIRFVKCKAENIDSCFGIEPERVWALRKQYSVLFLAQSGEHLWCEPSRAKRLVDSRTSHQKVSVDDAEGSPVPIPNTEVKLSSAEDSALATRCENREMPIFL